MSQVLNAYQQMDKQQFGKLICQIAPYFDTNSPEFISLSPGYSEVLVRKQRSLEKHIGTIHAIVMCNAAELVAGTMIDATLAEGLRWIPKGMTVQYLAKAKTDIRAVASINNTDLTTEGDKVIGVDIFDTNDILVFHADITMDVKVGHLKTRTV